MSCLIQQHMIGTFAYMYQCFLYGSRLSFVCYFRKTLVLAMLCTKLLIISKSYLTPYVYGYYVYLYNYK